MKKYLENPLSFATTLYVIVYDTYYNPQGETGDEIYPFLAWDPETLRRELWDDYQAQLPAINGDKLNVAINLITSDGFFKRLSRFQQFCNILSGEYFDPTQYEPPDLEECAWGITEGYLLSPPDDNTDDEDLFDSQICDFLGEQLKRQGILSPPDVLRIANLDDDYSAIAQNDPDMFAAQYQVQSDKSAAIEESLQLRLQTLVAQLRELPLRQGSAQKLGV